MLGGVTEHVRLLPQACYRVRELASGLWERLAERDKDYIAAPKPNGYRSLHSTLRVPSVVLEARMPLQ